MTPEPIVAHGVGRVYESPIPLWLYLAGAAATVLATLVVSARARRAPRAAEEHRVAGPGAAGAVITVVRAFFLVVLALLLVFAVTRPRPGFTAAPLLFWTILVVAAAALSAVLGDVWPRASPWALVTDSSGEDAEPSSRPPPAWLGPALLFALFWFELVSGRGFDPLVIVLALLGYTVYLVTITPRWGLAAPLADPLAILFGFASRSAPMRIDHEGIYRRSPLAGLDEQSPLAPGSFAALFVVLGSTTLDNLRETVEWSSFLDATGLRSLPMMAVDTAALAVMAVPFVVPFLAATAVATRGSAIPLLEAARRLAWSVVPIGVAYLLAHNAPLVMTGVPQIVREIAEPLGADLFATYSPSPALVWFLEVALVVGGHVLGVLAAQRALVRLTGPGNATVARHLPLTLLMSAYTIVTLWLLSLPLVAG